MCAVSSLNGTGGTVWLLHVTTNCNHVECATRLFHSDFVDYKQRRNRWDASADVTCVFKCLICCYPDIFIRSVFNDYDDVKPNCAKAPPSFHEWFINARWIVSQSYRPALWRHFVFNKRESRDSSDRIGRRIQHCGILGNLPCCTNILLAGIR